MSREKARMPESKGSPAPSVSATKDKSTIVLPSRQGVASEAKPPSSALDYLRFYFRAELVLPALLVFFLALPVFKRLIGASDPSVDFSDHQAHLRKVIELAEQGKSPPHPLYHYCVVILSLKSKARMLSAAAVVLALALGLRAYLSAFLFTTKNSPGIVLTLTLCLALALAMPLPNWWSFPEELLPWETAFFKFEMPSAGWWKLPSCYRGQLAPNVWHNPTGVIAMPFALLLFLAGLRALQTPRAATMACTGAAMVLSLLAKPNYVIVFAPCFAVAVVIEWYRATHDGRLSIRDVLVQAALACGPALLVLWEQYRHAFGNDSSGPTGVRIAPLVAWRTLSQNIPFSILLSIAFPLTVAALFPRDLFRDRKLTIAFATMAFAVAQYALLTETGERADHGNFGWGAVLANQVLFVVCCDFLLRQPVSTSRNVAFLILGLQVVSGSICLARCLFVPSLAGVF